MTEGTSATIRRAEQRPVAALLIAAMTALAMLVMILGPGGVLGVANAQTATPSPTPTGPQIEFINPSKGTTLEVSDKQDKDTSYHINAWVQQLPSDPFVEFEVEDSDGTSINIGNGTKVGDDTYELYWPSPFNSLDDGTYTLRAILYSGNTSVDTDEETIRINRANPATPLEESEAAAETVELTYPTNGGPLGYFTTPANTTNFLIDATTSAAVTRVTVYYTRSSPGREPSWEACASNQSAGSAGTSPKSIRIRCTVTAGQTPSSITAVAIVVNDGPGSPAPADPSFNDTSDAHRVAPYLQAPSTITVTPESTTKAANTDGTFDCVTFTSEVKDSSGRPIAGSNVDVHAKGPSDQLKFDTYTGTGAISSANQAPDRGSHSTENAWDCDGDETLGTQGEVNLRGDSDIKHIESTSGTDSNGQWKFSLRSDTGGTTQLTAWTDVNGDDLFCSLEPSDSSAIGWGSSLAPTVSALAADQSTCSTAPPSPTPTATTTTSSSPSASSSSSSTPAPAERSVTLGATKSVVRAGGTVVLSGTVASQTASCVNDETVNISRRIHGTDEFTAFETETTDNDGEFSLAIEVANGADYMASVSATSSCDAAESNPVSVQVRPVVRLKVSDASPARGDRITFSGKVLPDHPGTEVKLLRKKKGSRWVRIRTSELAGDSTYSFTIKVRWTGWRNFKVRWPSQDEDHLRGTSRRVVVRGH